MVDWKNLVYEPMIFDPTSLAALTREDLERGITIGVIHGWTKDKPVKGKAYPWIDDEYLNGDEQDSAHRNYRGVGHFPRP